MHAQSQPETPAVIWRRFTIWSVLALVGLLALGGFGRYSGLVLLAWAFGVVVTGSVMLLRQQG